MTLEETGKTLRPEKPDPRERIRRWEGRALRKLRVGSNLSPEVHKYLKSLNLRNISQLKIFSRNFPWRGLVNEVGTAIREYILSNPIPLHKPIPHFLQL